MAYRDTGRDKRAEEILLRRARAGDLDAFEELVRAHQGRIFGLACRMLGSREEAEEAAQEAFVRTYRALKGFRGEAAFGTYVYRAAVNLCLNRRRKLARERGCVAYSLDAPVRTEEGAVGRQAASPGPGPAREAQSRETGEAIQAALGSLEKDFRAAVVLRDVEGHSYAEISRLLGVKVGTVRSRIARGRESLREKLRGVL